MCPTLCSIPLSLYYPIWYQSERPRTAAHASVTVAPGGLRSPGGGQLFFSLFASSSHHPKRSISQAFVLSSIKQQQQRLRSSSISPTTWRTAPARGHPRATVDVWISVGHARPASPLLLGGRGGGTAASSPRPASSGPVRRRGRPPAGGARRCPAAIYPSVTGLASSPR